MAWLGDRTRGGSGRGDCTLGKSMGLGMDEDDINQFIKDHSEELTTEELKELQTQQHTEVLQEIDNAEKVVSTSEIKENLGRWEKKLQQGLRHLPNSLQKRSQRENETDLAGQVFTVNPCRWK